MSFLIQIDNVQLQETNPNAYEKMMLSSGSEELRRVLDHHNLRFSFQDGVVEELCPTSGESVWALNIKRAILSVFQNSMDDLTQDQKVKEVITCIVFTITETKLSLYKYATGVKAFFGFYAETFILIC